MTNDSTHTGATSRQSDNAALRPLTKNKFLEDMNSSSNFLFKSGTGGNTQLKYFTETGEKVQFEREGDSLNNNNSNQQLLVSDEGSSSTLRKRDSSSNLKSMGVDEEESMVPIVNWSKIMNDKSNGGSSSQSDTSTTLSESESGESCGKKSRSNSPERTCTDRKSVV